MEVLIQSKSEDRQFLERDCDLQRRTCNTKETGAKWERSYLVTKNLGNGAYRLQSVAREIVEKAWNASNLKHYY